MTETNAKIHVLADETLGGIKREYMEIDRKAEVGEKIVIVAKDDCEEGYKNGDVFTVDREYRPKDGDVECDVASSDSNCDGLIYREEYHVLEPTDIVHIGTERYELIDRKAEVGEKVIVVDADVRGEEPYDNGNIFEVRKSYMITDEVRTVCDRVIGHSEYRVLVPVETEADEPQPTDPIFAIGNLAQEVAKLQRRVFALELTNERQKIVNDRLKDEIDTLHKDNRTLGEELARLKEPAKSDDILNAPFALVLHEGRGKFDVYRNGKKIEEVAEVEVEVQANMNTKVRIGHFPGDWLA